MEVHGIWYKHDETRMLRPAVTEALISRLVLVTSKILRRSSALFDKEQL